MLITDISNGNSYLPDERKARSLAPVFRMGLAGYDGAGNPLR